MNDFSNEPIQPSDSSSSTGGESKPKWLTRKEYTDPAEKKRDFWIGFGLFFGLNITLSLCYYGFIFVAAAAYDYSNFDDLSLINSILDVLGLITQILPLVVNIGLLIYFGRTRSQVAMGMLTAFSVMLVLSLLAGVATSVFCFSLALTEGSEGAMYAVLGQVIVAAGMLVALIVTGVVAGIFYAHSRSSKDISSLRTAKFLAVVLAIVIGLAVLFTIGYMVISLQAT
jgi:hypothetical protein